MIIVRPICQSDAEDFIKFAFTAGIGMTSMPKNRTILERKVKASQIAFAKEIKQPGNEEYLFVLEDTSSGVIGGTCGINAKTGLEQPKYFYRIENEQTYSSTLKANLTMPIMRPVCYREAPSEICSLYLLPEFRKEGLGRLLSLSRFLFAATHLHRFDQIIYAEMRGFVDTNQHCPFWEGVGRHFLNIEYDELIRLRDLGNFETLQVLPKYPIYYTLLPKEVQEIIGKIHTNTRPAFHMLSDEGFSVTNEIDVFDGGPRIEAKTEEIRTIANCHVERVAEISRHPIEANRYILSNDSLDFRACYSTLSKGAKGLCIPADAADALKIDIGNTVRYVNPTAEMSQVQTHRAKEKPL